VSIQNRTIQMWGKVFSDRDHVTLTVVHNNQTVFCGPVTASNGKHLIYNVEQENHDLLCEWQLPIDLIGYLPFEIHVSGGTVNFASIRCNYISDNCIRDENTDKIEFFLDASQSFDRPTPRVIESDGKDNVTINGIPQIRDYEEEFELLGEWQWVIPDEAIFKCDLNIDPDLVLCKQSFIDYEIQLI
jgi:hypothetical protein